MALGREDIPNVSRILLKELPYRIVAPASWVKYTPRVMEGAGVETLDIDPKGIHHQMATKLFSGWAVNRRRSSKPTTSRSLLAS